MRLVVARVGLLAFGFYMSKTKHMLVQLLGLLIIILIGRMGKEAGRLSDGEV